MLQLEAEGLKKKIIYEIKVDWNGEFPLSEDNMKKNTYIEISEAIISNTLLNRFQTFIKRIDVCLNKD